jgi:hypothetical protein
MTNQAAPKTIAELDAEHEARNPRLPCTRRADGLAYSGARLYCTDSDNCGCVSGRLSVVSVRLPIVAVRPLDLGGNDDY